MKEIHAVTPKPTPHRVEVFAGALASGSTQSDAYRKMHPKSVNWKDATVHNRASEWRKLSEVSDRLDAIKQEASERNTVDLDLISKMHKSAYAIAQQERAPSAMTQAAKNLADLHGIVGGKSGERSINLVINRPKREKQKT